MRALLAVFGPLKIKYVKLKVKELREAAPQRKEEKNETGKSERK